MVALRSDWSSGEICLIVDVVASVRNLDWRLVEWTALLAEVLREEGAVRSVRAEGTGWAAENGRAQERVQLAKSPSDTSLSVSNVAGKGERSDGVETLDNIAKKSVDVEVLSTELTDWLTDEVGRKEVFDDLSKDLNGAVWSGTAVPVLWPLLWNVHVVAGVLIVLETNNAGDRLVVCNTASTVGSVGEKVGVEDEGSERYNRWEGEVVNVWVVGLGELADVRVVSSHGLETKVLGGRGLGGGDESLDNTRRDVVVISTAVVVVLTGRRDIGFDGRVAVQTTDAARAGAQVP